MSKWPRFRNRKWLKWLWLKWLRVMSFLSCFFVVSRISCSFAISGYKAIWHICVFLYITRWFQAYYCLLCRVNNKNCFVCQTTPAAYEISSNEQGVLLSFADRFYPQFWQLHHRWRPRSWGLERVLWRVSRSFSQNSDSISRFSYKVNESISRVPASKNAPFCLKITENLEKVSLKPTLTVNDGWGGETFVTF